MKKNKKHSILKKMGIEALNAMQEEAMLAIEHTSNSLVLSPTGSGKTLAFLLPLVQLADDTIDEVQVLILAPSRELAIQIETVARNMGSGLKINALYGGRSFSGDRLNIKHTPQVVVGTPGRVADHFRRKTLNPKQVKYLVLDEFDKSLEVGFEDEMSEILKQLDRVEKKILTSATEGVDIPDFVHFDGATVVDYLEEGVQRLQIKRIESPEKDKLATLEQALRHLGNVPGIIFLNYKDSIQRVSAYLTEMKVPHGCFYGGMEQKDRERALIKFRNGTHQLLLATDLAARGIDVPEINFIIHYHLPHRAEEFTHRNGRTARMNQKGTAYVLHWVGEELPDFIPDTPVHDITMTTELLPSDWVTVFISGGRRDKISKGDIAGLCFKQGKLSKNDLGVIELKEDCAFIAVNRKKAKQMIQLLDNSRLKKKKVRFRII
jgi:superfamily II DNA/RNA helicase